MQSPNRLRTLIACSLLTTCFGVLSLSHGIQREEEEGESQGDRFAQRHAEMVDEHGRIPADALQAAKAQRDANAASPLDFGTAGLDPKSWRWLGPGNIGGRCRALYIHPVYTATMLLGAATGGIWRTEDSGASWLPVGDFLPALSVSTIAGHPKLPDVLYAGTGETSGSHGIPGAGIFKSTDAGRTWSRLSSTAISQFRYVNRIVVHPTDNQMVIAATGSGVWRSTDQGYSWTQTFGGVMRDLDWVPQINGRLVGGTSGAAYYSSDNGVTWTQAGGLGANGLGRVELGTTPAGSSGTVYASCQVDNDKTFIYRSTDGGVSYTLRQFGISMLGTQGNYDNAVWVSPSNPDLVVVGGVNLFRSTDGAASWTEITGIHVDQHWIVHHPGFDGRANRIVYVCNDGGIYGAPDILTATSSSSTWVDLNNDLGCTQFYGGAVGASSRVFGGTQDNGTMLKQSSSSSVFAKSFGKDGGECDADPTDWHYVYAESQFAGILRSTDGGSTFGYIDQGLVERGQGKATFIAPMALDHNDPNRFWYGARSLWRTEDVKATVPTWKMVRALASGDSAVTAIGVTPGSSAVVYCANGSRLYKSTNATASTPSWTRVGDTGASPLPNRSILKIVISPFDADDVYVGLGGYSSGNVAKSEDGGSTWRALSGSGANALPATPIRGLAVHDEARGWLYAGTEVGVFASTDDGDTWSTDNDGPANVPVDELVLRDGLLWAFTHGRGIYRAHAAPDRDTQSPIYRASVSWLDVEGNNHSRYGTMTDSGRWIAFESDATNLVSGDTNANTDVFVRDRQDGVTERASVGSTLLQANGSSTQASFAGVGRWVAFQSTASNLVPGDTNGRTDVFVRDLQDQRTTLESVAISGLGNGDSYTPSLSQDGSYLVFTSRASNIVTGDNNGVADVFRRHRPTDTMMLISIADDGARANGTSSTTARCVSDDGRVVAFQSAASNLVPWDTNGTQDVFVRTLPVGLGVRRTLRVSMSWSGGQGTGASGHASVSGDGRYVVFESTSSLAQGDNNGFNDIYLRDLTLKTTTRVSVPRRGATDTDGPSEDPVISRDGRFVAFWSLATNLVSGDTNNQTDAFVRDLQANVTYRISETGNGVQGDGGSFPSDISDNGRHVTFWSHATNLVPNDTNARDDVLVGTRWDATTTFPVGRASSEGSTKQAEPLSVSSGRIQQAARDTLGRTFQVARLSFRRDGPSTGNTVSLPRTLDARILIGSCDIDQLTGTYDDNFISQATIGAQRKPFSMPDWRNMPVGLAEFDAHFPLDQPYAHDGTAHLLWDILVYSNSRTGLHPVDADDGLRIERSAAIRLGKGCQIGNGSFSLRATFDSNGPSSNLALTLDRAPTSRLASVMLGVSNPALTIPGVCGTLHTDAFVSIPIGTTTPNGTASQTLPLPAWAPQWRGAVLYLQGLSTDPSLGSFVLSDGAELTLPKVSPGPYLRSVTGGVSSGSVRDYGAVFRIDG